MNIIRHTLVSDGPTDGNLIPIIDWTLRSVAGVELTQGIRAEFWRLPEKPTTLAERLVKAVQLYPCDVLLIHRDAEGDAPSVRYAEIRTAFQQSAQPLPAVAIVPIRMLEAWMMFDESAIRHASGNPSGTAKLKLPPLNKAESCSDPK
jgi:hypothetical protein